MVLKLKTLRLRNTILKIANVSQNIHFDIRSLRLHRKCICTSKTELKKMNPIIEFIAEVSLFCTILKYVL